MDRLYTNLIVHKHVKEAANPTILCHLGILANQLVGEEYPSGSKRGVALICISYNEIVWIF